MDITCLMKLKRSGYRYVYSSFSCYPHKQQHNSYRYNISKPSSRVKNRVLQPLLHLFDKDTCYIMHIYDTLQLTLYKGSYTLYEWVLHAL